MLDVDFQLWGLPRGLLVIYMTAEKSNGIRKAIESGLMCPEHSFGPIEEVHLSDDDLAWMKANKPVITRGMCVEAKKEAQLSFNQRFSGYVDSNASRLFCRGRTSNKCHVYS